MHAAAPLYLLDANICIRILRDPDCRVAYRVRNSGDPVAISTIVLAEIARGDTEKLPAQIAILPFDAAAAAAFLRAARARGVFDRLIAAHALALGATLITHNVRDFREVPGLRIEDWTA